MKILKRFSTSDYVLLLIAISLTSVSGWAYLTLHLYYLCYLGSVGLMAAIMVQGPHNLNALGGCVFVIVNTAFFYYLGVFCRSRWRRMRKP
jgi:hypothetical protein